MGVVKKSIFAACAVLCLLSLFFVSVSSSQMVGRGNSDFISGPFLLSPTTGNIDLSGKDFLEFRWETNRLVDTDYFDFRLYKGYGTTGPIFQKRYSRSELPVKMPVSMFEVGQDYTWSLQQVFNGAEKSDRSFSSFKIINK